MIERIESETASRGVGPYSQAIRANGLIFVSGQLGIDPGTGTLVVGGTEAETHRALLNIERILKDAGSDWKQVVKVNLYLVDLTEFSGVNAIYQKSIGPIAPARSTIAVSALPAGARVEIDVIAVA